MDRDDWPQMEIRQLSALKALAEAGSLTRAAQRSGVSSSTISERIARLERLTGRRLVDRPTGKAAALTSAGRILLEHVDAIEGQVQTARTRLARLDSEAQRTLDVAVYQSVSARILPDVLVEFEARHPQIRLRPREFVAEHEPMELVASGALELAFTFYPVPVGPYASVELLRDPQVIVVSGGSELASLTRPVRLEDLATQRLIGFGTCDTMAGLESRVRAVGADTTTVFHSDDNGTIQAMAAVGLGAALMPRLAIDESDPRIVMLELDAGVDARVLSLAWRSEVPLSDAGRTFVDATRAVCSRLQQQLDRAGAVVTDLSAYRRAGRRNSA